MTLPIPQSIPPAIGLERLCIDDKRRLVQGDQREPTAVFGEGWYRVDERPFSEYRGSDPDPDHDQYDQWRRRRSFASDHALESVMDGDRLVWLGGGYVLNPDGSYRSTYHDRRRVRPSGQTFHGVPFVESAAIVPELRELLESVRANPRAMLNAECRRKAWSNNPAARPALIAIVAGVLEEFRPWPYPFTERSAAEKGLSVRQVQDTVVKVFDRILESPPMNEPTGSATMFLGLIAQRIAPITVWAGPFSGVWGFKIRYGHHDWLKGTVWTEPDVTDDRSPLRFDKKGERVHAGALRCALG